MYIKITEDECNDVTVTTKFRHGKIARNDDVTVEYLLGYIDDLDSVIADKDEEINEKYDQIAKLMEELENV